MSYTIAIEREDGEITRAELEVIPDLTFQEGMSGTNPRTGEEMTITGTFVNWNELTLSFSHGRLSTRYMDDGRVARMSELAALLGARVRGEEGEYLDEEPPPKRKRRFGLF